MAHYRSDVSEVGRLNESELVTLRRLADDLAEKRKERATTGHLLAAIASFPSPAADLLAERRLDADVLIKAARVHTDDARDAVSRVIQRARELAARGPKREAGSLHLLFALCQERTTAAYRAVEQCGTDVAKLRAAALQVAMGMAPPRRVTRPQSSHASLPSQISLLPSSRPTTIQTPPVARPVTMSPRPTPPPVRFQSPTSAVPPPSERVVAKPKKKLPAPLTRESKKTELHDHAKKELSRFALDPKKFPLLTQIGRNLTLAASLDELDPVVGREDEMERILDALARRNANNACVIGPSGVGKTSVVRGVALRTARVGDSPSPDDCILVEIEIASLISGTAARGSLTEKIIALKAEASDKRIVLFFDEIHTLLEEGGDEAVSELKNALAKGEIRCIGVTSREDYRRVIESDAALARRFTVVDVDEPSHEEAFLAIESVVPLYEKHHGATYPTASLAAAVNWSVRYVPGRALPDKALGILDLAGARTRRRGAREVGREQVAEVVAELAGVPLERLLETDGDRMLRLEALLDERIVGHEKAIGRVASVLRRNASGFRSQRPIGSFLLLGPTGVGKTETAKAVAECLFGSPDAMTRLDLSEYAEPHAIARLVGAPPGYVGHEAGGQLTEAVRRRPYQVVLLDEIEKAHRDVLEAFLQVFDEGRLTDGRGRTIDFTNCVLFMTSNIGAEITQRSRSVRAKIGFGAKQEERNTSTDDYEEKMCGAARAALPPELYNRLDEVLAFAPLTRGDVSEIARRMLASLAVELAATRGVTLDINDAAIEALLDGGGFDAEMGARPMRRAISRMIEAPLGEMILRGEIARGDVATIDVEDGIIVVDAVTPSTAQTA
ncbi:MAG: ATP-dependent Clp protease ATP-binding subunit [Polyangiaceae bacterium]